MHYRFYRLNRNDHIVSGDDVEAAHDNEAVDKVLQRGRSAWELWCGTRKVARAVLPNEREQPRVMIYG